MKISRVLFVLRIIAAIILLQTLFFKFTGAEESKYIFSTLGVEPWGRIFSGVVELIASILILVPSTQIFGALIGAGVMMGAILSHLFVLGIEVQGDGGMLFGLACLVLGSCMSIIFFQPEKYRQLLCKGRKKSE